MTKELRCWVLYCLLPSQGMVLLLWLLTPFLGWTAGEVVRAHLVGGVSGTLFYVYTLGKRPR
jgi:hypothetical protein